MQSFDRSEAGGHQIHEYEAARVQMELVQPRGYRRPAHAQNAWELQAKGGTWEGATAEGLADRAVLSKIDQPSDAHAAWSSVAVSVR